MKVILQRVCQAAVHVDNQLISEISQGLLLLVGFGPNDDQTKIKPLAQKICQMRLFRNNEKHFDISVMDLKAAILVVSQFTLFADTSKGRRPDFFGALDASKAKELYQSFIQEFKNLGVEKVLGGEFGADMKVSLINDGPVTLILEN